MIARVPASGPALVLSAKLGLVSVPDSDLAEAPQAAAEALDRRAVRAALGSLAASLGLVLLRPAAAFPEAEAGGPVAEDPAVRRVLEGLDAVWLREGEIVACFAIETGTAGCEGVRRLADLLALHSKLKAPLYAVTTPASRAGLLAELHRPALLAAKKPLVACLRLLEWERLESEVAQLGERLRYLKPEFLEGISEPAAPPAA
jgi:hypothetical protein